MDGRVFSDRREAGAMLAGKLAHYKNRKDVVVLALPRGGVPVAFEVAKALHAPLDIFLVRKLGVPGASELAMGAVASGGTRVLNTEVIDALGIESEVIEVVARRAETELARREAVYRGGRPPLDVADRIVILVDDGFATGSTMRAAVQALRELRPARIVVAAPAGAQSTCDELKTIADEVVCAATPVPFYAVGQFYDDFAQLRDEEVCGLLADAPSASASRP
jgi:predicted phosphoribosyltransferase